MLRRTLMAGLMLAPLFLSACEDKDTTGLEGTPGTVSIRAYVDSDGSGTFTTGDDPISGGTVTLTATSPQSALPTALPMATTDAQGIAKFTEVEPGSYTASLSGSAPEGAVLSSASTPTVVIPFQGGEVSSEFRFVYNPGSISGQLFRDNNSNNVFDAGDTPAPGQVVSIFSGTDTTVAAVATTTTDNDGVFTFTTLRPGEYTIKISAIPTISIVGGATQVVTVGADEAFVFPVKFTGSLIGTIADVRAMSPVDSPLVAVEGVVSAGTGTFNAASMYIQDATGGLLVFGVSSSVQPRIGDRVRVVGRFIKFPSSEELEIISPTVTILSSGVAPAPIIVTGAQINSFADQGELATINRIRVVSIGGGTGAAFDVRVADAAGTEFVVRIANTSTIATGLTRSSFTVGSFYDITGVLNRFRTTAQLQPRTAADVVPAAASISIAEARTKADGDTVTVEGVIYLGTDVLTSATSSNRNAYIVDNSGAGALIFGVPAGTTLVNGDSIRIKALVAHFPDNPNGEFELARFSSSSPPIIEKLGTASPPQPLAISAAGLASRAFDGRLVKVFGATVTSVPTTGTAFNVTALGADGTPFTIRVGNANTGVTRADFTVGQRIDVSGAALNFFSTSAQTFTPQVLVRSLADITPSTGPAEIQTIAEARTKAEGDSVTVEGVAYVATNVFNVASTYIMDGTGGINIFNVPTSTPIAEGDYIRVSGWIDIFSGEIEVARLSSSRPPVVEKLGTSAVPNPTLVTVAQLASKQFDGQLVRVNNVLVDSIGIVSGSTGSFNVFVIAPDGTKFIVRSDRSTTGLTTSHFTIGSRYDVTGAVLNFVSGGVTTPEVKPRSPADVVPATGGVRVSVQPQPAVIKPAAAADMATADIIAR